MSSNGDVVSEAKGQDAPGKLVNVNLISLKCLLFFFFGGMGCLLPFLPLHMLAVGLSDREIRAISIISPAVAVLGPLIAGPLADRVAASRLRGQQQQQLSDKLGGGVGLPTSGQGRYLRVMIAVCCVFSALFYSLLLLVPVVERVEVPHELRPAVKFSCDQRGAVVHQERCRNAIGCHRWSNEDLVGGLRLSNCEYACYSTNIQHHRKNGKFPPAQPESRRAQQSSSSQLPPTTTTTKSITSSTRQVPVVTDGGEEDGLEESNLGEGSGELAVVPLEATAEPHLPREPRAEKSRSSQSLPKSESPHVCFSDSLGRKVCHVFTGSRNSLLVNASLRQAINPDDTDDWCAYPVSQTFNCRIPRELAIPMAYVNQTCLVECQLEDPYDTVLVEKNVLAESQCRQVIGNEQLTFWMYLSVRCLADIFPTAAIALIDAAIVIATRETSTGRGDVGRQLAFGALGVAAFGPLSGYLAGQLGPGPAAYLYAPLLLHGVLALLAACIALTADSMPLSPPEWWWHTRCGMLALPMSAVRKYGGETAALFIVLALAGALWSTIDTYLSIHLVHLNADELSIGLALTIGALPSVLFLWKSEHLVDYCGHSNLLITAFIMYIVRYTGLSLVPDVWWALISEALELFTLEIMWVTAILYFRHLIPRQMTTTGQALPVIAHFCIGRAIGAVIGACVDKIDRDDEVEAMRYIYQCMAIAAAAIAALYFTLYHGILKPRCHAQTIQGSHRQPPTIVQAINGNGNYTPLRVYHNGMGRKGQFRY